jgi:hypothetical protein
MAERRAAAARDLVGERWGVGGVTGWREHRRSRG